MLKNASFQMKLIGNDHLHVAEVPHTIGFFPSLLLLCLQMHVLICTCLEISLILSFKNVFCQLQWTQG